MTLRTEVHREPPTLDLEARRMLCNERITLNDQPAVLCGAFNRFATVIDVATGLSAEWAWPTVARIISQGRHFRT